MNWGGGVELPNLPGNSIPVAVAVAMACFESHSLRAFHTVEYVRRVRTMNTSPSYCQMTSVRQ